MTDRRHQHVPTDVGRGSGSSRRADPTIESARRRLLDLAYDASSYLRHHREPAVRASAALLLAASLAACSPSQTAESDLAPVVTPLQSEVKNGLPSSPGRYPIEAENVARDAQGVYHFNWRQAGQAQGGWSSASASLMKLAEGDADELEVPSSGDPILHLRNTTPVNLVQQASDLPTPTPGTGGSSRSSSGSSSTRTVWYPFDTSSGAGTGAGGTGSSSSTASTNRTPAYRDPPSRVVAQGSVVRGGTVSTSPQPAPSRVVSTSRSTSGQAGGTGGGSAVSSKSGSTTSQGAARPGSSGFTGGKSGATGGSGG